jgi:hypothetical protein
MEINVSLKYELNEAKLQIQKLEQDNLELLKSSTIAFVNTDIATL